MALPDNIFPLSLSSLRSVSLAAAIEEALFSDFRGRISVAFEVHYDIYKHAICPKRFALVTRFAYERAHPSLRPQSQPQPQKHLIHKMSKTNKSSACNQCQSSGTIQDVEDLSPPLRSQGWYDPNADSKDHIYHRSWMQNQGHPTHLLDGKHPLIAVINTWCVYSFIVMTWSMLIIRSQLLHFVHNSTGPITTHATGI